MLGKTEGFQYCSTVSADVHFKPWDLNAGRETIEAPDREKIALVPG